jgi:hypothetical protein
MKYKRNIYFSKALQVEASKSAWNYKISSHKLPSFSHSIQRRLLPLLPCKRSLELHILHMQNENFLITLNLPFLLLKIEILSMVP